MQAVAAAGVRDVCVIILLRRHLLQICSAELLAIEAIDVASLKDQPVAHDGAMAAIRVGDTAHDSRHTHRLHWRSLIR